MLRWYQFGGCVLVQSGMRVRSLCGSRVRHRVVLGLCVGGRAHAATAEAKLLCSLYCAWLVLCTFL